MMNVLVTTSRETCGMAGPAVGGTGGGTGGIINAVSDEQKPIQVLPVSYAGAPPPDGHYLTQMPKHPGCKACLNCKLQRKSCRDSSKESRRAKRKKDFQDIYILGDDESEEQKAPQKFCDSVPSDSIFCLKRAL